MIDWVSIVRHSRRRFSNYVGSGRPVRTKKKRPLSNTPPKQYYQSSPNSPPQGTNYTCCCSATTTTSHVSSGNRVEDESRAVVKSSEEALDGWWSAFKKFTWFTCLKWLPQVLSSSSSSGEKLQIILGNCPREHE